ncbi:DUF1348 family protein [Actinopolyspora mortivallis]|uniref:DUF1348 family protein n=1 Tax=Actinopolyspora mortivallis TaxID=33906 RepID=UPI0006885211
MVFAATAPILRAAVRGTNRAEQALTAEHPRKPRAAERVTAACTTKTVRRDRDLFLTGRDRMVDFPRKKWVREPDSVLCGKLCSFGNDVIAICFRRGFRGWRGYDNGGPGSFAGTGP